MRILKGILYAILGLLLFLCLFIMICAFNLNLANSLSDLLYSGNKSTGEGTMLAEEDNSQQSDTVNRADKTTLAPDMVSAAEDLAQQLVTDYISPDRSGIRAPEEVSGRNGYVPVQDNSEQIDFETAGQLTYGETGDGLAFDTEYYPYYGMLDNNLQKLYRQIYANAMAVNASFAPVEQVNVKQLRNVFIALLNDHPEMFWLDSAFSGSLTADGKCVGIQLQFNQTATDLEASQAAFDHAANEILTVAKSLGNDYEKEVYVHNTLLDRIAYNLNAPLNQSAYSALVNGQTVCAGYARAFQYLMQQLGIPCYCCTGYAGESHAWNIIKLDGDYYNVDTTWDDTNPNTFDYFNKTDADYAGTHVREDLSIYLPACNGAGYGNLESNDAAANNSGKKSLADYDFTEQDVLTNMADYYMNCYNNIMQAGGSTIFQNVITDENMWVSCYNAYASGAFYDGYGERVMLELSAGYIEVLAETEALQDGRFLLTHIVMLIQ